MPGRVTAVIDGQFGSTGKGNIVAYLANRFDYHVRVGSPNAGHSFYWNGKKTVRQTIPVGHINPDATVVIGRGALINPRILHKELREIFEYDPEIRERLIIDARAGVLSPWHESEEGHTHGELHKRIGSTGEGVGAARIDRLRRDPDRFKLFEDIAEEEGFEDIMVHDTPAVLSRARRDGENILLEGAQGSGLDLIHGTWPYCTTASTGSAGLCADIGIPPQHVTDTILVIRTFPIRVAGNSGPLRNEISWEELSNRLGKKVEERTTVTKKVRRVGEWDWNLVEQAIVLNAPNHICLNFVDYLNPEDEGKTLLENLSPESRHFISNIEEHWNIPVSFIGTGGPNWSIIDTGVF